jgi:hypothetical protein
MATRDECDNQIYGHSHDRNVPSVFVAGLLYYPDVISLMLISTHMVTSNAIKTAAPGKLPLRTWATPISREQNISNESSSGAEYSTSMSSKTPPMAITARYRAAWPVLRQVRNRELAPLRTQLVCRSLLLLLVLQSTEDSVF